MAETDTKTGEKGNLKQTLSKHKAAIGITIVAVVALVIFLWSRNNNANAANNSSLQGANSTVPSAVAVPGPAGPTGPTGSRGPRGPAGNGNKTSAHPCPPGKRYDFARKECVDYGIFGKKKKHRPVTHHCPPGQFWYEPENKCLAIFPGANTVPAHMQPTHTAGMPAAPNHATFHPQNPAAKKK